MEKSKKRSEKETATEVEGYDGGKVVEFAGDAIETPEVAPPPPGQSDAVPVETQNFSKQ